MMRTSVVAFMLMGTAAFGQSSDHKEFPTTEEINLVVTQAERVFAEYKQSVEFETELPAAQKNPSSLENDKQVVKMSAQLIEGLKKRPEVFNGLGGLLLLTTLDDASRNAALCGSSGMSDMGSEILKPHPDTSLGYQILSITEKCNDVSSHIYTVSESVNALLVRTVEAQQELNGKMMDTLTKCAAAMKANVHK
jgi:hypothetical protein